MRVEFDSSDFQRLAEDKNTTLQFDPAVERCFRKRVAFLREAQDMRDVRAMKSLRLEKLAGKRKTENSIRINDQWRITFWIKKDDDGAYVLINKIEDYH